MLNGTSNPPVKCVQCKLVEPLLENLCEQCFRLVRIQPLIKEADRARQSIAILDTSRIKLEASLINAIELSRGKKPLGCRCYKCGNIFEPLQYTVHVDVCKGPSDRPKQHRLAGRGPIKPRTYGGNLNEDF